MPSESSTQFEYVERAKLAETHLWDANREILRLHAENERMRADLEDMTLARDDLMLKLHAADAEIGRLRAALQKIASSEGKPHPDWYVQIAIALGAFS